MRQAPVRRGTMRCSGGQAAEWVNRASHLDDKAEYAAAIAAGDTVIRLLEGLTDPTDADRNALVTAYMNRPGHGPVAAIADYDRAVALREELRAALGADWPLPFRLHRIRRRRAELTESYYC
jgi:hypothetical protein